MKALILTAMLLPLSGIAQEDDSARLREALKNTTLQLRTAQGETATAQAASIAAEQKAKALEAKVADLEKRNTALTKEYNGYKAETDKKTATLENQKADREKRIVEYVAAIKKWQEALGKTLAERDIAKTERDELAGKVTSLKNTVADRERKNIALFNVSNEILDRYKNYALGKSLAAKEPFIGNARVEIENHVQGYQDRILDQRLAAPKKP